MAISKNNLNYTFEKFEYLTFSIFIKNSIIKQTLWHILTLKLEDLVCQLWITPWEVYHSAFALNKEEKNVERSSIKRLEIILTQEKILDITRKKSSVNYEEKSWNSRTTR